MCACRYVRFGAHKARLAALAPGESFTVPTFAEARSVKSAAYRLGLSISVHRVARGQPEHRVTLIDGGRSLSSQPSTLSFR